MLNDLIKIDLHIHSALSSYKEDNDNILKCNIDNISVLLDRLEENEINLFSITDHNRFDFELYKAIKKTIKEKEYKYVKNILPGIEFDVQLEEGKRACHIITIFNDEIENLTKISGILEKRLLNTKEQYYTLKQFEDILYDIGLSTILIAHQKTGLKKNDYTTRSLSEGTSCPEQWISTGYISALEYRQTRVQGMIKKNLKEINKKMATITGSDCHNWELYPNKDEKTKNEYITKVKCLPTFKGLVFAFTSPDTRFDRTSFQKNDKYIDKININGKDIKLSRGINAIIGDNASGKTYLLEKLARKDKTKYNNLNKLNAINIEYVGEPELTHIEQNQIINDVREGKLFKDNTEFYKEISTKEQFAGKINTVKKQLKEYIEKNIKIEEEKEKLRGLIIPIQKRIKQKRYYPIMNKDIYISENINENRLKSISDIYNNLENEVQLNQEYYELIGIDMKEILKQISEIVELIREKTRNVNRKNKIKNIIINTMDNMKIKIAKQKTSQELENDEYISNIRDIAQNIAESLKIINSKNIYPEFPKKMQGISINDKMGFEFIKIAKYNDLNLEREFYKSVFTKDYQDGLSIEKIKTKSQFTDSISGITNYDNIEVGIENNVSKFLKNYLQEERYIREVNGEVKIGNTPGEIALTFYKIVLTQNISSNVILIDQPEDDISMKRIEEYLQTYLDNMRDKKQIIFVTHNPLLVVNLDVDNVIYIKKNSQEQLEIISGCLESEEKDSIIDIVGENLDGGYDTIERRLKIYGK